MGFNPTLSTFSGSEPTEPGLFSSLHFFLLFFFSISPLRFLSSSAPCPVKSRFVSDRGMDHVYRASPTRVLTH